MTIQLQNIGRRYNTEWIFRGIDHQFSLNRHTAILGANGSGKSTLLQLILGQITPSEGQLNYSTGDRVLEQNEVFQHLSFTAPYVELLDDFTMHEMLDYHKQFKPFVKGLSTDEVLDLIGLGHAKDKELKYFSSGMRQRVKLVTAILSDVPVVLLDEPTSNLDRAGVEWYRNLVDDYSQDRLFIVCSNQQKDEYFFCEEKLQIEDYK